MNSCSRSSVLTLWIMAGALAGCEQREPSGQPDAGQPDAGQPEPACSTPTGAPIEHQGTISWSYPEGGHGVVFRRS